MGALKGAGLTLASPTSTVLRASDGPDVEAALLGRDALLTCDAGFAASAQINDMADEAGARAELDAALQTAAGTPTADRRELLIDGVTAATIVDPESQSASAQLQFKDQHVAVVIGYADAGDLAVDDVHAILTSQAAHAVTVLR